MDIARHAVTRRSALRRALAAVAAALAGGWLPDATVRAAALPPVTVWKDPNCGCCEGWVGHMRRTGFYVTVIASDDMTAVRQAHGVPDALQSCHTAAVGGYVVEGHVPAADVARLLAERPSARGLAVPGMPAAAPGMDMAGDPYAVILFGTPAGDQPYAQH